MPKDRKIARRGGGTGKVSGTSLSVAEGWGIHHIQYQVSFEKVTRSAVEALQRRVRAKEHIAVQKAGGHQLERASKPEGGAETGTISHPAVAAGSRLSVSQRTRKSSEKVYSAPGGRKKN